MLCALACILVTPAARAAAPLCDPSGMSAVAPVPALPSATGEMSAPEDCDSAHTPFADKGAPQRDQQPIQSLWQLPDRAVPAPFEFPEQAGSVLPAPSRGEELRLPGHVPGVFRPPIFLG
jgi:hypothetical protein